jgi:Putative MetA-pathway of phenol degradation
MSTKVLLVLSILLLWVITAFAQRLDTEYASDPVTMRGRMAIDVESYLFHNDAQFYALRLGYYYGLRNERHLFGMSLPLVHTVFKADYAGFENTTGFGDLKMSYLFVPFVAKGTIGLERVSFALDVTAPTGEYRLGRGAGAWLYRPGVIFTIRPGPLVAFYPEVRYLFSGGDANSLAGSNGTPDPDDPEKDYVTSNLSVSVPLVAQIENWNGWFAFNILYTRSFTENTNFFFVRSDFGKMMGPNSSASLRISKFIAGQPRLNVIVQVNFSFFMR